MLKAKHKVSALIVLYSQSAFSVQCRGSTLHAKRKPGCIIAWVLSGYTRPAVYKSSINTALGASEALSLAEWRATHSLYWHQNIRSRVDIVDNIVCQFPPWLYCFLTGNEIIDHYKPYMHRLRHRSELKGFFNAKWSKYT